MTSSGDVDSLAALASSALAEGREEDALERLLTAARGRHEALLWQWCGLLQRALDDHEGAIDSFEKASEIAPEDAVIAHGLARVRLEAGIGAVDHFIRAMRLGKPSSELVLGCAAAMAAEGRIDQAIAMLDNSLAKSPYWTDGHAELAQLRSLAGAGDDRNLSIERTLLSAPSDPRLWLTLLQLDLRSSDFRQLATNAARAVAAGIASAAPFLLIAKAESGDPVLGDRPIDDDRVPLVWRIRRALRIGRPDIASALVDEGLAGSDAATIRPYALTTWQMTNDERFHHLVGENGFVVTIDLTHRLPPIDALADVLRGIHRDSGQFLDQSVRGGSQTAGALFSRIDPLIKATRAAAVSAVENYVRSLPQPDPDHPLTGLRRDGPVRFSGSWSVRLRSQGFHESHVHPKGWISSALYVALPAPTGPDSVGEGWLELGRPPSALGLDVEPIMTIEPRIGTLVLFPSWLWHGTRPFAAGERLTIAFDVGNPDIQHRERTAK